MKQSSIPVRRFALVHQMVVRVKKLQMVTSWIQVPLQFVLKGVRNVPAVPTVLRVWTDI